MLAEGKWDIADSDLLDNTGEMGNGGAPVRVERAVCRVVVVSCTQGPFFSLDLVLSYWLLNTNRVAGPELRVRPFWGWIIVVFVLQMGGEGIMYGDLLDK